MNQATITKDYGQLINKYAGKDSLQIDCGQFEGQNVIVSVSFTARYSDRYGAKGNKLFVSGEKPPHEYELNHPLHMEELQPGPTGKDDLIDTLWKQYNRKEVKSMKHYVDHVLEIMLYSNNSEHVEIHDLILDAGYHKKIFSPYAGCGMCKCSPGFRMTGTGIKNIAIHVNITRK